MTLDEAKVIAHEVLENKTTSYVRAAHALAAFIASLEDREVPIVPRSLESDDRIWMDIAIDAAKKGSPHPNPHVGALVVDTSGSLVGVGHHEAAGGPHAEIVALKQAGPKSNGATLYTTLEPCNHYGRTPPCAQAIVKAGIRRVVIGAHDPNPQSLSGAKFLLESRIVVTAGIRGYACQKLIESWAAGLSHGIEAET